MVTKTADVNLLDNHISYIKLQTITITVRSQDFVEEIFAKLTIRLSWKKLCSRENIDNVVNFFTSYMQYSSKVSYHRRALRESRRVPQDPRLAPQDTRLAPQ